MRSFFVKPDQKSKEKKLGGLGFTHHIDDSDSEDEDLRLENVP